MPPNCKYAIIFLDAAADQTCAELENRTPLEAAATPHCDEICALGQLGTVQSIPQGLPPQPDIALVNLAGYDPRNGYTGIGPLEAAAAKMRLAPDQMAFRCDLITSADDILLDPSAGGISTEHAAILLEHLNEKMSDTAARFHVGRDNHHLMTLDNAAELSLDIPPTYALKPSLLTAQLPRTRGADRIREILNRAGELLAAHDLNTVRRDLGENPANALWLWGGGRPPRWQRFRPRFGLRAAFVGTAPFARGLASTLGWTVANPFDADLETQAQAVIAAFNDHDLVIVHASEPGDATLKGDLPAKVAAIENADRHLVGPLLAHLRQQGRHRLLIAATLTGHTAGRQFVTTAPPYAFCGALIEPSARSDAFSESAASQGAMHIANGNELMEYFLRT